MNPKVDEYLANGCGRCRLVGTPACKVHRWQDELVRLRQILLDCGLTEDLKWSFPCYTYQRSNIVMLSAFKEYCALSFFKGALLEDTHGILVQQTENVQAGRQIRYTHLRDIVAQEAILKSYIFQAIEVEKAGLKVEFKKATEYKIPEEFQKTLDENPVLKAAFEALTPGRQKAYLIHFAQPKQSKTREARIEKCIPLILNGKGLND